MNQFRKNNTISCHSLFMLNMSSLISLILDSQWFCSTFFGRP